MSNIKFQKLLSEKRFFFEPHIVSTSIQEVSSIQSDLGGIIPLSLKEFFQLAGGSYDYLLGGGAGDKLQNLLSYKTLSNKILEECGTKIEKPYLVFSYYGGDQFLFVYIDEGEDPAVYRFETELYYCGDDYIPNSSSWGYPKGVSKIADSFSAMINKIVERKIKENPPR
jgi:hypothetical protein